MSEMVEQALDLPVVGAQYAPGLMDYLRENNVNILPAPPDPYGAVREGQAGVVLVIGEDYGPAMREGRPAPLEIIQDSTRQATIPAIQRASALVSSYAQTISAMRLVARGVDPSITTPLAVRYNDIATPQSRSMIFLNMMPFLLIMTVFSGGMYVIIDATAGERERGSLEPLLINPIPRRDFALGKLLASLPFGVVTLALALALFAAGFAIVPLENYTGMQMDLEAGPLVAIFLLSLPIVLLASALQMVVATFTRSFKEAQTYLPLIPLIAGLPGAFLAFIPVKMSAGIAAIPIFSQSVLINQFLRNEMVNGTYVAISCAVTTLLAVVFTLVSVRLYQREKILFGGR
jgi:sodium transport system permease protein